MILADDLERRPEPPTNGKPAPTPGALTVALVLVGLLFYNLFLDAQTTDYDGKYVTFAVVGLIAGILSVDVSRFWRGKGDQ